jgi:amino acid transporter
MGCFPLAIFELTIPFLKHPGAAENVPLLFFSLAGTVIGVAFSYGSFRANGVYLHESREQQLARSQTRMALLGKLAWLIVTAAISTAGTLLVAHQTGHLK